MEEQDRLGTNIQIGLESGETGTGVSSDGKRGRAPLEVGGWEGGRVGGNGRGK